jgi:hypothetical protein
VGGRTQDHTPFAAIAPGGAEAERHGPICRRLHVQAYAAGTTYDHGRLLGNSTFFVGGIGERISQKRSLGTAYLRAAPRRFRRMTRSRARFSLPRTDRSPSDRSGKSLCSCIRFVNEQ